MTSALSISIGKQLADLEAVLRNGVHIQTPDGAFAQHVYEAAGETGPVPGWEDHPTLVALRQGHAPALAAEGYRLSSKSAVVTPNQRNAWQEGIHRLSGKDAFASDRQTFAYRPIEVLGIALGAATLPSLDEAVLAWLRDVLLRLERESVGKCWTGLLCEAATGLHHLRWQAGPVFSIPHARPEELSLRRWLLVAHSGQTEDDLRKTLGDLDAELLRRAVSTDLTTNDIAAAAVLHHAIRRAAHARLQSDLASTWQVDRQTLDAVRLLTTLCRRFHLFAKQLESRHGGRPTLPFTDEYDVQDAMHALLRLHCDDVRPEEWTPSYGGKSTRMDFLLKREQVVVEVKMTRKGLTQKEIIVQLTEDKERYRSHPDCRTLVCFVYDPAGICDNPNALEDDLSVTEGAFRVTVVVAPKGT